MCGEIRRSETAAQAVDFAIAYARSGEPDDQPTDEVRELAGTFLENYTPYDHREEARALLAARPDDGLTTELSYYRHVVY